MSIKEQVLNRVVTRTCRRCGERVVMPGVPLKAAEFCSSVQCEKLCTTWTNVLSKRFDDEGGEVYGWDWDESLPTMDDYVDWSGP